MWSGGRPYCPKDKNAWSQRGGGDAKVVTPR